MTTDPDLKDRLSQAIDDLPLDVERRLDAAHTGLHATRRGPAYAVAAVVALLAVFAVWRLLPLALDRGSVPGGDVQAGAIAYAIVDPLSSGEDYDLYLLDPSTGVSTSLVVGAGGAWSATFSPDGSQIAFTAENIPDSVGDSVGFEVVVMNADGSNRHVLAPAVRGSMVAWSPDGTRLAYVAYDESTPVLDDQAIRTIHPDGTNERTYTHGTWEALAWSPDSTQLVAAGYPAVASECGPDPCTRDLYVLRVGEDGSRTAAPLVALTHDEASDGFPRWSPDGSTIVFMRNERIRQGDYAFDIASIPASGGAITMLTDWKGFDGAPLYSPDGRWIVFLSDRDATATQLEQNANGPAFTGGSLFVMAADGTDVRSVSRTDLLAIPWAWTAATLGPLATPVPEGPPPASYAPAPTGSPTPGPSQG